MAELNPYQSPDSDVTADRPIGTGERVYKIGHVGLATFLGTPAAGAWLLAANYVAMGEPEKRAGMLWLGLGATVLAMALGFFVPASVPALPLNIAIIVAMIAVSNSLQGESLKAYVDDVSLWHSGWRAAGIGLLFMLGVIALIAAIVFIPILLGYESVWE